MKLLFIPGSGAGKEAWTYQTEHFANSEAVALPGHPEGKPCSSVEEYMEWLRGYIQQHRYHDIVLAGHSMGSAVALLYGLKYSTEVKGLILIGAGARLKVLPASLTALEAMVPDKDAWRKFLEQRFSRVAPRVRQAVVEARMKIGAAVTLNDFHCCDKFDVMDRLQNIKLPTLVICGNEDEMTPVKYSNFLAGKIEGAVQVVVDGVTHYGHMEKPEEYNRAIEEFMARPG